MAVLIEVVDTWDAGGGDKLVTARIDFGDGPELVEYGLKPGDQEGLAPAIRAKVEAGEIAGQAHDAAAWAARIAPTWDTLRGERDRRLAASDWAALPDVPLLDSDRAAVATYRQALRDLPDTYPDASAVVWPVKPTALG